MNHFQRLNEAKELKIFFFAQRTDTRKQASNRQPFPCDAMAPTVQNRAGARCPDRTRQRCAQQTRQCCTQHTSSYHILRQLSHSCGITFFEGPSFLGLLTICISSLNSVRWFCRGRAKRENARAPSLYMQSKPMGNIWGARAIPICSPYVPHMFDIWGKFQKQPNHMWPICCLTYGETYGQRNNIWGTYGEMWSFLHSN